MVWPSANMHVIAIANLIFWNFLMWILAPVNLSADVHIDICVVSKAWIGYWFCSVFAIAVMINCLLIYIEQNSDIEYQEHYLVLYEMNESEITQSN